MAPVPEDFGETAKPDAVADQTAFIGRYRILNRIGEGGFGEVYEAEQTHPVRRRVALKVIKVGMDTRDVIARFAAERQALAMMDHPNIAHVLDAGSTETGRPYFVMELVSGEPISSYCDRHKLSINERLALFEQVCLAVQHAHTKGVIHRDLKPSNVLVSTHDDVPFAKVIDFGIAKATGARLTDDTLYTAQHQMIGTPLYMSPEQAEGSADIDTRTDIYSLGVLLYELLTGTTPFEPVSLRGAALVEIQRIIREVEPVRPSACVSRSGQTLSAVAAQRRIEPTRLTRLLRGELDWIAMKAIEKDRSRRYETANGFARDIRRYLEGQPVVAAPPSAAYRIRKFTRRHRAAVAAGVLVAMSLIAGMVAFAWQANIAAQQARIAADQARIAEQRAVELEQVSRFQAEMLSQVDPTQAGATLTDDVIAKFAEGLEQKSVPESERPAQVERFQSLWRNVNATDTARDFIDRAILKPAVAAIDSQFKEQPLVDARLRQVLAERYRAVGLLGDAVELQRKALAIKRRELGSDDPDVVAAMNLMGLVLDDNGQRDEAEAQYKEALETGRKALGNEHPATLTAINNMGSRLLRSGNFAEAEKQLGEVLATRRRVLGNEDPDTLESLANMGSVYLWQSRYAEAEPYFREALTLYRRVRGDDHADTIAVMINLGSLLSYAERLDEAESVFGEALGRSRRVLGENHPITMFLVNNMGALLRMQERLSEAEPYLREALRRRRSVLGDDHPETIGSMRDLGVLLRLQGRFDEAEPLIREVLERRQRPQGMSAGAIVTITELGRVLIGQKRLAEAESLMASKEADARKVLAGTRATSLGEFLDVMGRARAALQDYRAAEANLTEAYALQAGDGREAGRQATAQALVELYSAWNAAEHAPSRAAAAEEWKRKLTKPGSR